MDVIKTTVILREIRVPDGKALKNVVTEQYHTGTIDPEKGYWIFYLGKEENEDNYIFVDESEVPQPELPEDNPEVNTNENSNE